MIRTVSVMTTIMEKIMTAITIAIMNMDAKETVAIINKKQHGIVIV